MKRMKGTAIFIVEFSVRIDPTLSPRLWLTPECSGRFGALKGEAGQTFCGSAIDRHRVREAGIPVFDLG